MNNKNIAVEYIKPKNELILKTGMGGLDKARLDAVQSRVNSMSLNIDFFLDEKFASLKKIITQEAFVSGDDKFLTHDYLSDLVAFNVHAKLTKRKSVTDISSSLLKFSERLNTMNPDAYNVIRAHVNTLDVIFKKSLDDSHKDIMATLIKELNDACDRYYTKYTTVRKSA